MSNFSVCVNAIVPIFLIMAAGYAAGRSGLIKKEETGAFNKIAFRVFLSLSVFSNIYGAKDGLSSVSTRLMGYCLVFIIAEFIVCTALTLVFEKKADRRGVVIQGIYRSNFVILGLPLAKNLLGADTDVSCVAALISVVIPVYNALAVVCLEVFSGKKVSAKKVIINILKNPLIISSLLAIAVVALKIKLPIAIERAVSDMAGVASPLMVFLLGASLDFSHIGEKSLTLLLVCISRLVAVPAAALFIGYSLGFRGAEFAALIGVFATPTAVSSYTMVTQIGGDSSLAGNIVVFTSALCCFTVLAWSLIFKNLGAF